MSLVSVVVPIYNVQDYLEDCLDSLRAQTLGDIEILCVNDGSTDGSLAVLQTCATRDPRIRIIDKPNGGLSSARNAGIDAARSPYVCFLDSDDRFEPHACEEIYRALHDGGADVFTFAARWTPEDAAPEWMVLALSPRDEVYEGFSPDLLFTRIRGPLLGGRPAAPSSCAGRACGSTSRCVLERTRRFTSPCTLVRERPC